MSSVERIISIDELYGIYKEGRSEDIIVDVRDVFEYQNAYIENSLSLPHNKISKSSLKFIKVKNIYLVCREGNSAQQCSQLMQTIYSNLNIYYVAQGGMKEWIEKKYPIISQIRNNQNIHDSDSLNQNEPDLKSLVKKTRLLPVDVRERVKNMLPSAIRIYLFKDKNRNSYLICDFKRHEAVVINPLNEIHHEIIDQIIRDDCHCILTLYFDFLKYQNSPQPVVHAADFSVLVGNQYCSVKALGEITDKYWAKQFQASETQDGSTVLTYFNIAFVPSHSLTYKQSYQAILPIQ